MPTAALRVALLGGVPALLGGGGLEIQVRETMRALRALGHDARPVHEFAPGDAVDVVHAFNHTGDVAHYVEHWRRTPAAFVLSPVLVVRPSHEWRTRVGRHLPIPTFPARALRDLLRKADAVVGLTEWERAFMVRLGPVPAERCVVVGNGVTPVDGAAELPALPDRFVVSVGSVSPRKGQHAIADALREHALPYVVVGSYEGADRAGFDRAVAATGGRWLGEISDPGVVRGIVKRAEALVLVSEREGQSLAVLEALACGTTVIVSDLPSHRELQALYPEWVRLIDAPGEVPEAVARRRDPKAAIPAIPSWNDVAEQLVDVYRAAIARGARTGQERP